jgi:hypothetical protein
MNNYSPAGAALGFGNASLADQVSAETEAQRKKRLAQLQASRQLPSGGNPGSGYSAAFQALGIQ